jgi:tRNA A-37 threonylcarbamoyl transferase component Bud32
MDKVTNNNIDLWLERVVTEQIGRGRPLAGIRRSRYPHIGSYDCERVTVEFRSGDEIVLFLKNYSRSRLSKDQPERRRIRELGIYRDLLHNSGLGTPDYYAAMCDDREGKHWLLLELVEAEVVEDIDEHNGVPAVNWLARMQRHFLDRADDLTRSNFLIEHDAAYFQMKAADATRDVATQAAVHSMALEPALECYLNNIDRMTQQPRCLVHGAYIPWHIFIDRLCDPIRVCAVDWELAARGATLYDLAIFVDDAPAAIRERLCLAYSDAAVLQGVPVPDMASMRRIVDCFRLHRVVDWLSRSEEKGFSVDKISWLVNRAESLAHAVAHDE